MPSLSERFANLRNKVQEQPKEQKSTKARVALRIDEKSKLLLEQLAKVNAIYKIAEAQCDSIKSLLKVSIMSQFTGMYKALGTRPQNPALKITNDDGSVDIQAIFQIRDKVKVQVPTQGTIADAIIQQGFTREVADRIVEENLYVVETATITPLNELAFGQFDKGKHVPPTEREQALAEKVMGFIETLDEEEYKMLVKQDKYHVVKSGILERLPSYCENAEQLEKLMLVLKPESAFSHLSFAANDAPAERNQRLLEVCNELITGE